MSEQEKKYSNEDYPCVVRDEDDPPKFDEDAPANLDREVSPESRSLREKSLKAAKKKKRRQNIMLLCGVLLTVALLIAGFFTRGTAVSLPLFIVAWAAAVATVIASVVWNHPLLGGRHWD